MSDEYKPNKMEQQFLDCVETIAVSLKEIKQQLVIKNKIDSTTIVTVYWITDLSILSSSFFIFDKRIRLIKKRENDIPFSLENKAIV